MLPSSVISSPSLTPLVPMLLFAQTQAHSLKSSNDFQIIDSGNQLCPWQGIFTQNSHTSLLHVQHLTPKMEAPLLLEDLFNLHNAVIYKPLITQRSATHQHNFDPCFLCKIQASNWVYTDTSSVADSWKIYNMKVFPTIISLLDNIYKSKETQDFSGLQTPSSPSRNHLQLSAPRLLRPRGTWMEALCIHILISDTLLDMQFHYIRANYSYVDTPLTTNAPGYSTPPPRIH